MAAADRSDPWAMSMDELRDTLTLERTILLSLEDSTMQGPIKNNADSIRGSQEEVTRLEKVLKARETKEKASRSRPAMARNNPRESYAGPSGHSTPASASTSGASGVSGSGFAHRKRAFPSHFDDDDSTGPRNKSYRMSTSPLHTDISTPSATDDFCIPDDATLIDLTGDDGDFGKLLEDQRRAFSRIEQQKEDERVAKSLNDQFQAMSASPMLPAPPARGPTAFDRILGRPRQQPAPSAAMSSQDSAGAGSLNTNVRTNDFSMPGAYVDDDEGDLDNSLNFDLDFPNSNDPRPAHPPVLPQWTSYSSASLPPANPPQYNTGFAPNLPAAELARRAALTRQDYDPLGDLAFSQNSLSQTHLSPASGFSGFPYGQPMATASFDPRPGMLSLGFFDPFQGFPRTSPPSTLPSTGNNLSSIIGQTNNIDWANGLDALGRPLNDRIRSYYDDLHDDPRKTQEEINELLKNIRPDEDIPEEERIGTPDGLRYPLYPHQQLALQWMQKSEDGKNKGGILADDMGLGKTISALALMVSRASSDRIKTNLIVGPVALIKQWETELKKKVRAPHNLSVYLLHNKPASYEELRRYDVVLTSYGKLGFEEKRIQKWVEQHPGADPASDADLAKSCPLVHPRSKFYRIILDEAQCIKNSNTLQSRGASRLAGTYRWCLTGTPMMNGIHELYSLIKFLKIAPYADQKQFTKTFGCLSSKSGARAGSQGSRNKAMRTLRVLLRAIMLRRMKTSKLDGKPLVDLPPKTEEIEHVVFDEDERGFYTNLEARTKITFNKYLRAGTVGKNYSNVLVLLLRLRQACCHPHLNLDVEYVANSEVSKEDMNALAKTLSPEVVSRLKAANEEGFNCPICLDAVIDPTIVLPCGHNSCGECFATMLAGADDINLRAGAEGGSGLKCPECRGPINPKNVINLTSFKAVHMPTSGEIEDEQIEEASEVGDSGEGSSDDDTEADDDSGDDMDDNGNLKGFIVDDDQDDGSGIKGEDEEDEEDGDVPLSGSSVATRKKSEKGKGKGKSKAKGKEKAKEEVKPHMLKTLRTEAKKNKSEYKRYMKYLKKNWLPSAKVSECCRLLQAIQESGEKTIVFSQFTFLLDLLEIPVRYQLGIKYCRYDGGMSRIQRDAAAQVFQDDKSSTKVMLVSLKAGNAGLNLTAANHVIIMDPFWNPYIEMQAVDRAHRIGQRKPVQVHRLLVKETVEDRIAALQEKKREFVDAALDEGESKQLGRLSQKDLQYLFNGGGD